MLKKVRNYFFEENAQASWSDVICSLAVVAGLLFALYAVILAGGI